MGGVLESNNLASWDIFHTTIPKSDRFFSLFYDREIGAMNYSDFRYASFGHCCGCYNICSISSNKFSIYYEWISLHASSQILSYRYMHIFGQKKND
jgi:hypothetical protein